MVAVAIIIILLAKKLGYTLVVILIVLVEILTFLGNIVNINAINYNE